jgi:hypothetical protein
MSPDSRRYADLRSVRDSGSPPICGPVEGPARNDRMRRPPCKQAAPSRAPPVRAARPARQTCREIPSHGRALVCNRASRELRRAPADATTVRARRATDRPNLPRDARVAASSTVNSATSASFSPNLTRRCHRSRGRWVSSGRSPATPASSRFQFAATSGQAVITSGLASTENPSSSEEPLGRQAFEKIRTGGRERPPRLQRMFNSDSRAAIPSNVHADPVEMALDTSKIRRVTSGETTQRQ